VRALVDAVGYANLALFTIVAFVALREWRARKSPAGLWAACTFAALALVVDAGRAIPEHPDTDFELLAQKALVAGLVLFPYFLYRFSGAFRPPPQLLERLLGIMTAIVLIWTFANPRLPAAGEPRPAWYWPYLAAFIVHWTVLAIVVSARLWRAGADEPSVARKRMRTLTVSAAAITVALFLAIPSSDKHSVYALASGLLASVSAIGFLLGFAPPAFLRLLWRRPEQRRVQEAIGGLMAATTVDEVAAEVLPPMSRLVGARALELRGPDGALLGSYRVDGDAQGAEPITRTGSFGSLLVWTSPYAPFFSDDELKTLDSLASLLGLALDRARLFEGERHARGALERADEVKTNFIALAAHELRTPVASAYGLAETLRLRPLTTEQRGAIDEALFDSMRRMAVLVEQLLDLSRLDAEAMPLSPEQVPVRRRIEEIVRGTLGAETGAVQVEIDPGLLAQVDSHALERIVSNLVSNALRYGEPPVTVRAEQTDRHFRVAVEDHGSGVSAEFVPSLFQRFARSESSARRVQGSGLGLAIARSFARAHGGDLLYAPTRLGGARFELVLPVAPSPDASTAP
jgi:signal transduction histidine kinase